MQSFSFIPHMASKKMFECFFFFFFIIYAEANVMNIYAKFQLHPPYGF